jgi:uncharacterized protein (DUF608 family)
MSRFVYRGQQLEQISFPLGGIGSGTVGLSGTGRLIDWEIFNRPNKRSLNGFSHLAIKIEEAGRPVDARVLNSDLPPPYMGESLGLKFNGFGFGPARHLLAGVPHFRTAVFTGTYPLARIDFSDETFPADVALTAFNPLIPLNDHDSSLPVALFEPEVTNTADVTRDFVLAMTIENPLKKGKRFNTHLSSASVHLMRQQSTWTDGEDPDFGELTFSVSAERVSWQEDWFKGAWFDSLGIFWQDFTAPGDLKNRRYSLDERSESDGEAPATLTARLTLAPGETGRVRFALAWYFPNMAKYWQQVTGPAAAANGPVPTWRNYYAMLFDDALAVNLYAQQNWDRLEAATRRFMAILYRSSLPEPALEAVTANISLLRSPTCLRLTDGSFYAFEGCHSHAGCCEGSCTHVWNYAYALPYLFPKLERSMRELDYRYNLRANGEMPFRLQLPPGSSPWSFRACVDGQLGGLIKVYREWQIFGDTDWLRTIWPAVKKSLEFAWEPTNRDRWDPGQNGYLSGRQHHTLDMELFGPNAWLTGIYLAALAAGSRLADAVGDAAAAEQYRAILARGRDWVDANLYNGAYFIQQIDLKNVSVLDGYEDDSLLGKGLRQAYWNSEAGELKYQIGAGCAIDQVLAQWHSDLVGLGDLFDPDKVQSALQSIFRYNYQASFRHVFNPCRIFALNDEVGTVICAWPEGTVKPVVPAPYSEETMHGFEYQAGCHMILRGLEAEGLAVISAVRDRYDGQKRNPWNEIECGSNYARSMASFALLLAYSGFRSEMSRQHLVFRPLKQARPQQFFWSVDAAWGEICLDEGEIRLLVEAGQIVLRSLAVPESAAVGLVRLDGQPVSFSLVGAELHFAQPITLSADSVLLLRS